MVFIFSAVVFLLCGLAIWKRNYKKESIKLFTSKRDVLCFLYPFGLWIIDVTEKRQGSNEMELKWAEAVYLGKNVKDKLRIRKARRIAVLWLGCVLTASCGVMISLFPQREELIEEGLLERPDFGEKQDYEVVVEGIAEEAVEMTVSVSGREPTDDEIQHVFDEVYLAVEEAALGDNVSLERVSLDLNLVSVTNYGIRVRWKSLNPEYINDRGEIIADEIPDEGVLVGFQVTLSYAAREAVYYLYAHLVPQEKNEMYFINLLKEEMKKSDEEGKDGQWIRLPETIEEKSLKYLRKGDEHSAGILILIFIISVMAAIADRQKLKEEFERRNTALIQEYPSLLWKLNIMLSCGLTLRSAWKRIIDTYLQKKKEQPDYFNFLYEEMLAVQNQIEAGKGEGAAYRDFGKRCGEECYLRLGNYLEQNLKQGVSGLQKTLENEMRQALEEKRQAVLRAGEAANTKLLLPMMLMLGVVIAVLVTPAMLSM